MKYFIDLDDTLVNSTILNNDAYNFALEMHRYDRILTNERITREFLNSYKDLDRIIKLKQSYFTSDWLPYRLVLNKNLLSKLNDFGKMNCYLWTKADEARVGKIMGKCDLLKYFNDIIIDKEKSFKESISKLKDLSKANEIVIYENNHKFFEKEKYKIIDEICSDFFDVKGYLV